MAFACTGQERDNASGIVVGFELFGGLNVKPESIESILQGGVAFATPNKN